MGKLIVIVDYDFCIFWKIIPAFILLKFKGGIKEFKDSKRATLVLVKNGKHCWQSDIQNTLTTLKFCCSNDFN